ncbi:cobalamin-binding protein [Ralstonia flaminis]|jgi:iron complex transport system substrate-binding protein|uniref:Vitamin B12-binding protein n=1 Tax=Ralstonia flaminis TaxID=3058597 RepID=A0ABN9JGS1_9RALS|nr:cobalamin-binding protein [Ralstonia sp. LMG 18101]CAJ0811402.1 Vitamin B12-binding protein [Ralstonia sp. LMG 18101]
MPARFPHFARRLCVLGLAALAVAAAPALAAISVTDDTGATVTLQHPAQRIVSLAPHATELLFAAGGGARIVGTVAYSDYPPAARDIPHVGDNRALDLERIAALKPDLVVVWRHGNAQKQIDRLRALGIPLFFSEPHRMGDIPRSIEALGTLLDTRASAHDAAQQFRQQVDTLRNRYASKPPVQVFYQVWEQPLMTLNGQHIFTDMLALCGGRNIFASEPLLVPTVLPEAVIAANPEVLLTASMGATQGSRPIDTLDGWKRWPQLLAVQRGNLFSINGDLINRFGPRLVEAAAQLCDDLEQARMKRQGAQATNNGR